MGQLRSIAKHPTDEKAEKALAMCERYRLISDNDGHQYVIKVWQTNEFYQWVDSSQDDEGAIEYNGRDFNEDRIEGGLLSFTDPKVG